MSGCQCNNPNVWEYGLCDYCSSTDCHDCGHELDACPKDCDCECNQDDDDGDDIETLKQAVMNDFINAYNKASEV